MNTQTLRPGDDWLTVVQAANALGVSEYKIRKRIRSHDLHAIDGGPRGKGRVWLVDARQVRQDVEAAARAARLSGVVSGYGPGFVAEVDATFGPAAAVAVADTNSRDDLAREAAAAIAADPALQARLAAVDEDAAIEAQARAVADRVRRIERIQRRAAEILQEEDEAAGDDD